LRSLPHERVVQFHLAGHTNCGTHLIDTHDGRVVSAVWELYRQAHELTGGVATLLEWDARIPSFEEVHAEVLKARDYMIAELGSSRCREPSGTGSPARLAGPTNVEAVGLPHPLAFIIPDVA